MRQLAKVTLSSEHEPVQADKDGFPGGNASVGMKHANADFGGDNRIDLFDLTRLPHSRGVSSRVSACGGLAHHCRWRENQQSSQGKP